MSDEIVILLEQLKNRQNQLFFYIFGFIGGIALLSTIGAILEPKGFIFISFLVMAAYTIILYLLYNILKSNARNKLYARVNEQSGFWKYDMVEEVINQIKTSTPISIERITSFANELLMKDLEGKYPTLNLNNIEISSQDTLNVIQQILAENPSLGAFYQVENIFVKQIIIKKSVKIDPKPKVTCFYCGSPMQINQKICYYCQENSLKCSVCKLTINFGDAVGQCSLCDARGHLIHMQEWVKTQGKCPVCLQALPLEGIVPEEISKAKKK